MKRHERCSISGRPIRRQRRVGLEPPSCRRSTVKYHYSHRFFTNSVRREASARSAFVVARSRFWRQVLSPSKTAKGRELGLRRLEGGGLSCRRFFSSGFTPSGAVFRFAFSFSSLFFPCDRSGPERRTSPSLSSSSRSWEAVGVSFLCSLAFLSLLGGGEFLGFREIRLSLLSSEVRRRRTRGDPLRRHCQAGSLTGAVHLSNGNAGVLRRAQRGQKPRVEQKGKSWLDPDFQYEYGPRKRGLSILLTLTSF